MSSTSTNRSRSRGTLKCSAVGQTCNGVQTRTTRKISKYFAKPQNTDTDDNSENCSNPSDSPYKNCQGEVKSGSSNNSYSDLDDFKTPKAINKVSKILSKAPPKNTKKKRTRQPSLRKFVEDNLQYSDVRPEHLQMALALSESTYEAENPHEIPTSQEKRESFKEAFTKFGFGYMNKKPTVGKKKQSDGKKNYKKSRWRYITPVLKIRTNEEREALISSKISLILAQNNRKSPLGNTRDKFKLYCKSLQEHAKFKIFQVNGLDCNQLTEPDLFYVSGLGLEKCLAPCGRLLKDWRRIPGREPTPERNVATQCVSRDLTPSPINKSANQIGACDKIATPPQVADQSVTPPTSRFCPPFNNLNRATEMSSSVTPPPMNEKSDQIGPCSDLAEIFNNKSALIEISTNESETTIICDSLTPPTTNKICNQIVAGGCNDFGPLTSSEAKTSPNGSPTITKRCLSTPFSDWTPPTLSQCESAGQILHKYEEKEEDSDCYIIESPEIKENHISPKNDEIVESTGHETRNNQRLKDDSASSLLNFDTTRQSCKYCLTPGLERSLSEPITIQDSNLTPPHYGSFDLNASANRKRRYDCISPDLFDSYDSDRIVSPEINRLRGGQSLLAAEIKCYDLTSSDKEEKSLHLRLSDPEDSIDRYSDLHVTDYVQDLLSNYKEESRKFEKVSTSEDDSQQSQTSVYVSDEELNYSSVFGTPQPKKKIEYSFSEDEDFGLTLAQRINQKMYKSQEDERVSLGSCQSDFCVGNSGTVDLSQQDASSSKNSNNPLEKLDDNILYITPNKASPPISLDSVDQIPCDTPSSSSFVIKTKNVTPMANYDEMNTPKITEELDRFGLKPLKRKKGAKLLKYIYESTHPVISDENCPPTVKKRRTQELHIAGIIGEVGEEEEIILEKKQLKKVASCAVPLHIVWFNFVMSNPKVRENILLYEPLQLEVLHSMLKDQGFKFNIQDLLAFLDKKCVTIRTAQGLHRKPK